MMSKTLYNILDEIEMEGRFLPYEGLKVKEFWPDICRLVPKIRLDYLYRKDIPGRHRNSIIDTFNADELGISHINFIKYIRYLIYGPDLPLGYIEFMKTNERNEWSKRLINYKKYDINRDKKHEVLKLCFELGLDSALARNYYDEVAKRK